MFKKLLGYAKAAFFNEYHLPLLIGSVIFAFLTPITSVLLPLIVAGELIYMSAMVQHPRFQRFVDSTQNARTDQEKEIEANERVKKFYNLLSPVARSAYDSLRDRCDIISRAVPHASSDGVDRIADWQTQGVNKLLFVYLKLLYTRQSLNDFLSRIDERLLDDLEGDTKKKMERVQKDNLLSKEKMLRSLQDTLNTVQTRKTNLLKAKENYDFIGMELDRISAKLTTLSEMAINRQDPAMLTAGVDDVANSVQTTEQAIGELSMFAGIPIEEEYVPSMMNPNNDEVLLPRKPERRIRI